MAPWVLLQQNVICPYINNDNDVELVVVCILCYTSTEEEKKKLPIKASCCQNSRTIIISRDLEPVWKKIRFASIDRIALQSSFSIQNLFKFFTLIFFVKSFSRKFTWKSFHEKFYFFSTQTQVDVVLVLLATSSDFNLLSLFPP